TYRFVDPPNPIGADNPIAREESNTLRTQLFRLVHKGWTEDRILTYFWNQPRMRAVQSIIRRGEVVPSAESRKFLADYITYFQRNAPAFVVGGSPLWARSHPGIIIPSLLFTAGLVWLGNGDATAGVLTLGRGLSRFWQAIRSSVRQ